MKKYFKKLKIPILIQIFFSILYSITETLFPLFNRYLFDNIMIDGLHLVVKLIILYVIVIICNCFFQYVSRVYEWKVQRIFMLQIKNDLFNHIVSLNNNEFGRRKPSDYLSIFNNNVEVISEDYISAHIDLVKSSLNILTFTLALLFFVDWRITLVILTSSIIIVFLPRIMKKTLSKSRSNQLKNLKLYFRNVLDLLSGKKRINKFTVKNIKEEHYTALENSENTRLIFGKHKTMSDVLSEMGIFVLNSITFITVSFLLLKGEITIGIGVASFSYATSFLDPIRSILSCVNVINSSEETVEETLSFLNNKPLTEENINNVNIDINSLDLKDVSYKAGDFNLENFTYNFESGKKYAIIGHSGSGKSTIMKLIDGTLNKDSGSILVDGKQIENIDREEIIFSIDQFEHLFQTNFYNNMTIFNSVNDKNDYVNKLFNKLEITTKNKILNYEEIDNLSGGERQILGIIRMLVADRPIILMDESFANIDVKNTKIIKEFILSLENKIIIEVTHNISNDNLQNYDYIINLDEGKILA